MKNEAARNFSRVFRDYRYVIIALGVALIFYLINVFILNINSFKSLGFSLGLFGTLRLYYFLSIGLHSNMFLSSFISLVIICLLVGTLFSMILYKTIMFRKGIRKRESIVGFLGAFLGALVPGCAVCGVGLGALIGLGGGALALLPLHGLEIALASIILLFTANYLIARNLANCTLKRKVKGGKHG